MNPITIIRERIAESRRREEGVTEGPWIDFAGVLRTEKRLVGVNSMSCQTAESADSKFMASARLELPMWRSIAERAVKALERIWSMEMPKESGAWWLTCGECESDMDEPGVVWLYWDGRGERRALLVDDPDFGRGETLERYHNGLTNPRWSKVVSNEDALTAIAQQLAGGGIE